MGLDSVEMIITVEERFGIHIPDREAERIRTVGDLYRTILQRLRSRSGPRCKTQHAFYRLRSALPHHLRGDFRPGVRLRDWLDSPTAYATYQNWQREVALSLPRLTVPDWFTALRMLFGIAALTVIFLLLAYAPYWLPAGFLIFASYLYLFNWLDGRYRRLLPDTDIRSFCENFTATHHSRLLPMLHNDEEVYALLRTTIVTQLGVDTTEVHPGASFADDLGLD